MKAFATTLLIAAVVLVAFAPSAQAQVGYGKDVKVLGLNATFTDPTGFGADFEYGLTPNISLGGVLRYWGKSTEGGGYTVKWSLIMPQVQGMYHFMPREAVDPFVGARLGYGIYSTKVEGLFEAKTTDNNGMFLNLVGGCRYWFTPQISGHANLEFRIAGEQYFKDDMSIMIGVGYAL